MRSLLSVVVLGALGFAGCAGPKSHPLAKAAPAIAPSQFSDLIVTPDEGLAGKVAMFDPSGRFVVLNFPVGHLPALEQRLFVYRLGLKVGEVRVSGPQRDDNIVGDLVAGEARAGDTVRDQ